MKKIFFLVITCLIFTYPIAGFAQEELDEKIETLYKQGVSLYKDNRLDEADAIFIKLLRVNPEHQGAQLYLYEKIPDKIALRKAEESALKNQEELAKRNPSKENIETFYQTAVSLYNKNQLDIDKAKVLFAKILKLDPDHKGAKIYLNQKIPDKIEKKRQLAKRRGRKRVQAEIDSLYAEGRSLYDSGELDKARATFYKIFVFDPDHKGTKIYLREKIPDKIEQAKLAEQRRVEELRRQEEEAREELRRQQEQAKERARQEKIDTLYKEAIVLYNDDQLDKAKESLVNVLELDPNHKGANFYLDKKIPDKIEQAKVAEERRLKELARQEEQAKLAEQRRLEELRRQEEEAREQQRRQQEQAKEKALKEKTDTLYTQARSLYDSDDLGSARDLFYQILELDPEHSGAKLYLDKRIPNKIEQAKLEQKRVFEELRRQEEQAKEEAFKEKIDAFYKQAKVLYKRGDLDKAKDLLTKIIEIDPEHSGANLYLDKRIPNKIEQARLAEQRRLKELARQEEQAKLAEQRRLEQQRRQEQEAKEKVQLEKKQVKEEAPTEYVDEVLVYDADRVRQEQFAKQEIILEEATQVYKAQTRDDQAMAKDLERARQGQFAKEEAIVEAKAKAYKERITQESLAKDQEEKAEEVTVKEVIVKEEPATEPEKETPVSGEIEHEYRISTGDSLEISLYGEPDMKQVTRVSEEGVITYPFLGSLEVGGLTPQEAEKKIEELLGKEYFVNPQVRITIKSYAKFNILGEVRRPGSYEISGPMTVIDAISIAGGFTDIASQNGVRIVRKQGDKSRIIKVPVKHILKTGDNSKNVYIKKGDTIVVPESFF